MKRMFTLLLGAILFAGLAVAHGGEQHIMGTVTKITDTAISVEVAPKQGATQKPTLTVRVVAATKFEKSGAVATIKDLKVGDRVVIHAGKKGNHLEAHVVKIGMAMDGMH
jgi:preprotein translocase subunit YajC